MVATFEGVAAPLSHNFRCVALGAVVVVTVAVGLSYSSCDRLTRWYTRYRLAAVATEVLASVLCVVGGLRLARRASPSVLSEMACVVFVQTCLDVVSHTPSNYANRTGGHGPWAKALMAVGTYLVARRCRASMSVDTQTLSLLSASYVSLHVLYWK